MIRCLAPCMVATLLVGCRGGSPESQVRAAFGACRAGVESGDMPAVVAHLDPAFRGPEGMDLAQARLFLFGLRGRKIGITVLDQDVAVQGRSAHQRVTLILTGKDGGALLPDESSRRTLHLRWEQKQGDWRLVEVTEER